MKTAALLTCHNRKEKTLACLKSLYRNMPEVDVYLTDDGCADGTAEAVKSIFPFSGVYLTALLRILISTSFSFISSPMYALHKLPDI